MADRSASADVIAAAGAAQNKPVHLVEVYFDTGTVFLSDSPRPVLWNGNTYPANGHLLSIDGIEESAELRIQEVGLKLTGCDQAGQTWIAIALAEDYVDRRLVIRKAFLDDANNALTSPVPIFDGRISDMQVSDDPEQGESGVTVLASSHLVDFERIIGRRTNDVVQQNHFAGDKFFEFCSEIPGKQFTWGRPT